MDLSKLQDPFPAQDIEWRVGQSGKNSKGIFCMVLAYITARAIQSRLDKECGPAGWKLEEPRILDISGNPAFACGISIYCQVRTAEEWITKWDVSLATAANNIDAAKSGWSGAMKRAGAQWGIGRYLYYLDATFAKVQEEKAKGWNWAKLPEKHGGGSYYWQPPRLPEWALPKDNEVSKETVAELAIAWREKFAADIAASEQREGFVRFVHSVAGEFPVADHACWTLEAIAKCRTRIESTVDPSGPDADIPFGAGHTPS